MGNPIRGEVSFDAEGAPYVLQYTFNWLIALEEHLDLSIDEIGAQMSSGSARLSFIRTVFWFGLRAHQPDITEAEAGDVITAVSAEIAGTLIGEALAKAFKAPDDKGAANGAARPQKARASGTGKSSTPGGLN